jgi:uncharacterized protein YyaL (SSP411 family)
MIAALAKAARAFDEPGYAEASGKAIEFILSEMKNGNGKLMRRYRDGDVSFPAFLEDYAFFIWGLLEQYEATFEPRYIRLAIELNKEQVEDFWDGDRGGFYFTSKDSEEVLMRRREAYDGAVPSGNSVAMLNLVKLSRITGDSKLEDMAYSVGRAFSEKLSLTPMAYTFMMKAISFLKGPSYEIVIVGNPSSEDTSVMVRELNRRFIPNKVVLMIPEKEGPESVREIAEFTEHYHSLEGMATAYVCRNHECDLPTTNLEKMMDLLEK